MKMVLGEIKKDDFIRMVRIDNDYKHVEFFRSVSDALEFVERNKYRGNIYYSLGTTDGTAGATENIKRRRVLAFDFDKKELGEDFNYKDIIRLFKKIGIYYHALVSSGNGYHVYVLVEDTQEISKLIEVNKALAKRLNADMQAVKPTQILRVPSTFNMKDEKKRKNVNIIFMATEDKQKQYNLDKLYNKYCISYDNKHIQYVKTSMTPCIVKMLEGAGEGHRNFVLGRLTAYFKKNNYSKDQALEIIKEWNTKCSPSEDINKLEKDFLVYWNSKYKLLGCISQNDEIQSILSTYCEKYNCNKQDKFEVMHTGEVLELEYKIAEQIKYRGENIMLNGNHIAIISILKIHKAGLNTNQLKEELTSTITNKPCMSKPTMNKALNELVDANIIDCKESRNKNIPHFYKLIDNAVLENQKYTVSYHAIQRYIDNAIGQSALRIYAYMLYKLSKGENVVQENLARELNISQKAISRAIQELKNARYLIIETDYSVNPLGANQYRWLM